MTKELREKLTELGLLLTALAALGAGMKGLREALQGARTEVWTNWPWYVIPTLIFLAILFWRRDRLVQLLNPRSTVSRRDAFHIGRKYLLGREEDTERLLRSLAEWPLVFLVGESGAGKSSLLERGVLPRLKEVPGQFPILINSWGPDWIEGPREALAQALEAALDESLRKLLGVEGPVSPGDALAVVGGLRSKATRTPILLFDQIDDYQTRHRDKFLSGPERTLLSAEALAAENSFWREVAKLLQGGGVRCLFATRSDANNLESVRFQEPKIHLLDPLKKSAAADLLEEISKDSVNLPEKGFGRLKERLLNDLSADGWVLPIQMQVAFSGLAEMRFLSVGEYERQGGLRGLEALHLESRISAAARAVGVSVAEVRTVLLSMVDRATHKTVPQPTAKLQQAFPGGNPAKLMDLLEKLESDEVARRRIDPGREGIVWLLDHDYLSRGVIELDRRAQRWPLLLDESARSYEGASGIFEHWKKLLAPLLQIRLVYERLRGQLRYGSAAPYARISIVKILIWLLIPLLAWFGWRLFSVQREAERLFAEFSERGMTAGELRALWRLTGEDRRLRRAFLDTALAHGPNARRFTVHGEHALHATLGFREEDRLYALKEIVLGRCMVDDSRQSAVNPDMLYACVLVIQQVAVPAEDLKKVLRSWLRLATDVQVISAIHEAINSSPGFSDPELIASLSHKALQVYSSQNPRKIISTKLVREDRRKVAEVFLRKLRADGLVAGVIEQYGSPPLEDVINIKERNEMLAWIAMSIEGQGAPDDILRVYKVIEAGLSVQDRKNILKLALSSPRGRDVILSSPSLMGELDSEKAREMLEHWFEEEERESVLVWSPAFDEPLLSLAKRLNPSDAAFVWRFCIKRLGGSTSVNGQMGCLQIVPTIVGRLSPADVEEAFRSVLSAIERDIVVVKLNVANILGGFKGKMPLSDAQHMSDLLIQKLSQAKGAERCYWISGLVALGPWVSASMLDTIRGYIVEDIRGGACIFSADPSYAVTRLRQLKYPGPGSYLRLLEPLGSRLTPEGRRQVVDALLARFENQPSQIPIASRAIGTFSKDLSPELVLPALQKWIEKNRLSEAPDCAEVVPLILDSEEAWVIDLLKWPTCSSESRDILIKKLDDLVLDASFGTKGSKGEYRADLWGKFLPWARKQGLDVDSSPVLPSLDRLNLVEGIPRYPS